MTIDCFRRSFRISSWPFSFTIYPVRWRLRLSHGVNYFLRVIREIQYCELAVVFFCSFIVCLAGVDFIAEITDYLSCVINANHGAPSFLLFVIPDTSVLRGGVYFGIAGVSSVVGGSGGAEVGFAIV